MTSSVPCVDANLTATKTTYDISKEDLMNQHDEVIGVAASLNFENCDNITTDALDNIEVNSKNNVQWSDCAEEIDIGGEYIIESINETPNGGTLQAIENQAAVLARELQSDSDESDPDYPDYTPTSDFEFNEESRHDRTDLNLNKPNITNAEAEFTNIGAQRSLTKHVETKKQQQNRRKGRPYLGYKINSSSSKKVSSASREE